MQPAFKRDAASTFARIYDHGVKIGRERLAAEVPLREDNTDDVEHLVGPEQPLFDAFWTKENEAKFMEQWNDSDEKRRIQTVEIRNAPLHRLWKSCVRLMRCSPFAIISPRDHMQYEPDKGVFSNDKELLGYDDAVDDNHDSDSDAYSVTVWSKDFCDRLDVLVSHPMWGGSPDFIKIAIQYAVACRTADLRRWEMPATQACPHMQRLAAVFKHRSSGTVQELYEKVAKESKTESGQPTLEFQFLGHLGSSIKTSRRTSGWGFDKIDFKVRTVDLGNVVLAINTFSRGYVPMLVHTDIAYQAVKSARSGPETPLTADSLKKFHVRSWVHESRMQRKDTNKSFATSTMFSNLEPLSAASSDGASSFGLFGGLSAGFSSGSNVGFTSAFGSAVNSDQRTSIFGFGQFGSKTAGKRHNSAEDKSSNKRQQQGTNAAMAASTQTARPMDLKPASTGAAPAPTPTTPGAASSGTAQNLNTSARPSALTSGVSSTTSGRSTSTQPDLGQRQPVSRESRLSTAPPTAQQAQSNPPAVDTAQSLFAPHDTSSASFGSGGGQR
ncbi:oxysterol-binding protein [Purpureocillium lavendulum]|uniref:Oxysterol-binding protein n=1 Tax=Purpureocillium lavendulum TaxID=1247861 RepID=A0AB34G8G8_9HYPO|nr:oxysterol-binding protein [Purpureocillium lavendulum]